MVLGGVIGSCKKEGRTDGLLHLGANYLTERNRLASIFYSICVA